MDYTIGWLFLLPDSDLLDQGSPVTVAATLEERPKNNQSTTVLELDFASFSLPLRVFESEIHHYIYCNETKYNPTPPYNS
jgi:hypothetical protein